MNNQDNRFLVKFASFSKNSRGRLFAENSNDLRTCFQRDRDRILHSAAFRRLKHKTQVFLNEKGDYYRTRLTHTLEVSQISRSIAYALNLNEDLTEAIALSHDLGHPPFGHAGEEILNEKMINNGGFDHNEQAIRITCILEKRYSKFSGLNLSWETIEGMIKHNGKVENPREYIKKLDKKLNFELNKNSSLEGQIAAIADEIAYLSHDFDDGLNSGLLNLTQIKKIPLIEDILIQLNKEKFNIPDQITGHEMVRKLISIFVNDVIFETKKNIRINNIESLDDVRSCDKRMVLFSKEIYSKLKIIRSFLLNEMWHHSKVNASRKLGQKVIDELFNMFLINPKNLIRFSLSSENELLPSIEQEGIERLITDKISSLTDRNAIDIHSKYFNSNFSL